MRVADLEELAERLEAFDREYGGGWRDMAAAVNLLQRAVREAIDQQYAASDYELDRRG